MVVRFDLESTVSPLEVTEVKTLFLSEIFHRE